jgi:hypothetical protein
MRTKICGDWPHWRNLVAYFLTALSAIFYGDTALAASEMTSVAPQESKVALVVPLFAGIHPANLQSIAFRVQLRTTEPTFSSAGHSGPILERRHDINLQCSYRSIHYRSRNDSPCAWNHAVEL